MHPWPYCTRVSTMPAARTHADEGGDAADGGGSDGGCAGGIGGGHKMLSSTLSHGGSLDAFQEQRCVSPVLAMT